MNPSSLTAMAKRHCTRWGRGKKGRKVCRAYKGKAVSHKSKKSRKGGVRGLAGLSSAALSALAGRVARCENYYRSPQGVAKCAVYGPGPGLPNMSQGPDSRSAVGVKRPYTYGQPRKTAPGTKRKLPSSLRKMQFTKGDAARCKMPKGHFNRTKFANCMNRARNARVGA